MYLKHFRVEIVQGVLMIGTVFTLLKLESSHSSERVVHHYYNVFGFRGLLLLAGLRKIWQGLQLCGYGFYN